MLRSATAAFIPVRLSSTRLSGKAMRLIHGKRCIDHLIERVKRCHSLDLIVLCTTNNETDNPLKTVSEDQRIELFRGSEIDILDRYLNASRRFNVKNIINVDGDDIFCEPMLIDKTAQELNSTDADCILWRGLPIGASPVGIRASALEKICSLKETTNTETGWTKFFTETGLFKVKYLDPPDAELADKGLRLTLDYPEDLELFEQIFDNLDEPFDLRDIVRLLHKNPRLQRINDCVKAIYDQNFASKSTEVRLKDSRQPKL